MSAGEVGVCQKPSADENHCQEGAGVVAVEVGGGGVRSRNFVVGGFKCPLRQAVGEVERKDASQPE